MTAFDDKITDKLWDKVEPIITVCRVLELFLLTALFSPSANELTKLESYTQALNQFFEMWKNIISSTQTWIFISLIGWVFLIAPIISNRTSKFLIKRWHIKYSDPLLDRLAELKNKACNPINFTSEEIQGLLILKNKGLKSFEQMKTISEVCTTLLILLVLIIAKYFDVLYASFALIIWFLVLFLITQKMLIISLTKIQPFNVVNEKLNLLSLSK